MRQIDITKQDIRCCDEVYIEPKDHVNFAYELWFDVDKYFGTDTTNPDVWLNFYTNYHSDGRVTASYEIDTDTDNNFFDWELTEIEQAFFKDMMAEYCRVLYGCALDELLNED